MESLKYTDGIVNQEEFNTSTKKILWILREVNHDGDICDWNMCEILQTKIKGDNGIAPGWSNTFAPIIYSTYGILNNLYWREIPYCSEKPEIIDILKKIAYINVKRTAGGATVNHVLLEEAYSENKQFLLSQINYINPDIIIYGGTFHLFEHDLDFLENKSIKHISAYHPGQRTISQELYCDEIIESALSQ